MGEDADWADVKVEDDMPTAQSAPSEAAAAARAVLAARKPPPPADDGDSDEEGAAAPQAPRRSSCRSTLRVPTVPVGPALRGGWWVVSPIASPFVPERHSGIGPKRRC